MSRGSRTVGFVWALAPLVTLGIGTSLVFVVPAVRLRKPIHWVAVLVYLAMTVTAFATTGAPDGSAANVVFTVLIMLLLLGGTVHAFAIRSRVFPVRSVPARPRYEGALAMATHRRELRRTARDTARDPVMAWELRIGRPDLPRGFDDGGLVDVNHAPPYVLASLPGMNPGLVDRILQTREQCGGFSSVEELSALAQLPPTLTETLAEYTIFLP
ncbi:MAG: ComEA family DNA-binding protein [Actinoallomurus sp.]